MLQGKDIGPANLLYEGAAIVLVTLVILILRFSERFSENEYDPPPYEAPTPTDPPK